MRALLSTGLAALAMSIALHGRAQELVVNGGFETATVGIPDGTHFPPFPEVLDGWSSVDTDGEFILGNEQAHSGNGFMSVLNNGDANPGLPWLGAVPVADASFDRPMQVIEVASGVEYVLRYWYRGGDGSRFGYGEGDALVQVEEMAPLHASYTQQQRSCTGTWQQDSITFTTGPMTTQVVLLFSAVGVGPTDTWFDDISLRSKHPIMAGIDEQHTAFSVTMDPAMQVLRITSTQALDGRTAELWSTTGARVRATAPMQGSSAAIDVAGLADGLFVLVLAGPNGREARKVLITR